MPFPENFKKITTFFKTQYNNNKIQINKSILYKLLLSCNCANITFSLNVSYLTDISQSDLKITGIDHYIYLSSSNFFDCFNSNYWLILNFFRNRFIQLYLDGGSNF